MSDNKVTIIDFQATSVKASLRSDAELFSDIIITAIEGGVNYWAEVIEYKHEGRTPDEVYAVIRDAELPDEKSHRVDSTVVAAGLQRMLNDPELYYSSTGHDAQLLALGLITGMIDIGEPDASDCSAIVQIGLFGDVVYG